MPPLELRDRPPTPVSESSRHLERVVSRHVGIVRVVDEVLAEASDIRLANLFCETGWLEPVVGRPTTHLGAGSAAERSAARAAAIGEAVERYSACASDVVDAVVASAAELGPEAVNPCRFALFADEQYADSDFRYARFDERTPVAWVEGFSLPDGEPALLPAQLVYLGWRLRPGETPIFFSTSSGLACHVTVEEALATGLLELLERDAFMITWRARLSHPRLTWAAGSRLGRFVGEFVAPTGVSVAAIDLSAFWNVPCVLGVARAAATDDARLGVGAAAAASIERAVEKAFDEAIRVRSWARSMRAQDAEAFRLSAEDVRTFEDHIRFHSDAENAGAAAFLDASRETVAISGIPSLEGTTAAAHVLAICARLQARGMTAYAVDVTSTDVADAGLRVLRAVVPELSPLDVDHRYRALGGRRLYEEPARLGLRPRALTFAELNPDPHPFP